MKQESTNGLLALRGDRRGGGGDRRFLAFSLCGKGYAVPLLKVREVLALTECTPLPHAPAHFKGIMNLRGLVISVIDLRTKFAMRGAETTAETAIVILDLEPVCLGVVVDSVNCVLALDDSQMSPAPSVEGAVGTDYVQSVARVGEDLVLILDIDKALGVDDRKIMQDRSANDRAA